MMLLQATTMADFLPGIEVPKECQETEEEVREHPVAGGGARILFLMMRMIKIHLSVAGTSNLVTGS